jgi:AraC-like DNA-binding protein
MEDHPIVPYIRQFGFAARSPWFLPERRLLDYLLLYVQEGEFRIRVDGEELDLRPGDCALVQPGSLVTLHGITHTITPFIHMDIFYNPHRSQSFPTRPGQIDLSEYGHLLQPALNQMEGIRVPVRLKVKDPVTFRGKLLDIVRLLTEPSALHQLKAQTLAGELIVAILESYSAVETGTRATPQTLNWVTSFLSFHLSERVTVKDLAKRANFSPSRFNTLFRERFGMSPHQYLLNMRIASAKDLLATTNNKLEDIARYCGFHDIHHFYKMFKKETRLTPGQYRARLQSGATSAPTDGVIVE